MYSPKIIAAKARAIESQYPIRLRDSSVNEIIYWTERLKSLIHPNSSDLKPKLVRPLNEEEQAFVSNEIFMTKINFPYWATRYAFIKYDKGGVDRLKLAESQEMLLEVLGRLEELNKPVKIINLKARQVYASTLSACVLTHKAMNIRGITSIVASDTDEKSEFIFNMMERIYDNLPFYLKPQRKYRVKGTQLFFDRMDSLIAVDQGNKRDGGIGQGMTVHSGHLSELATWNNTDQITQDLIPAVVSGEGPNTFFIMESTANGKSGWWYETWKAAKRKKFHDFVPVFIPWWIMKEKYAADPEDGWGPSERVLKLAVQIKQNKGVDLNRKQMFWWDKKYESYQEADKINEFYAEYASDDNEAFQLSGKTVFPIEKINDLLRKAKTHPKAFYEVQERMTYK